MLSVERQRKRAASVPLERGARNRKVYDVDVRNPINGCPELQYLWWPPAAETGESLGDAEVFGGLSCLTNKLGQQGMIAVPPELT
jgi:hypothetical protein